MRRALSAAAYRQRRRTVAVICALRKHPKAYWEQMAWSTGDIEIIVCPTCVRVLQ